MRVAAHDSLAIDISQALKGVSLINSASLKKTAEPLKKLEVVGSSIKEINGTYMEWGTSCQAIRYRNVMGWVIFRHQMHEIPELGIYSENCYNALSNDPNKESLTSTMYRKAGSILIIVCCGICNECVDQALNDIVDMSSGLDDGSVEFKRRFAEISRTGNRMITIDHLNDVIHGENLRAHSRVKSDMEFLRRTASRGVDAAMNSRIGTAHSPPKTGSPGKSVAQNFFASSFPFIENPLDTREISSKPSSPLKTTPSTALSTVPSTADPGAGKHSYVDTIENLDFSVLMSKNIHTQHGSQLGTLSLSNKNLALRESELTLEVMKCIEAREAVLRRLAECADDIQSRYLKAEEYSNMVDKDKALVPLSEHFNDLRFATIAVTEAIGAWSKLSMVLRKQQEPAKNSLLSLSATGSKRPYTVAIAVKGEELYPASKPVASKTRRFQRGFEEATRAVEVRYIGVYPDKDTATQAFLDACNEVPFESRYAPYYGLAPKMMLGLRSCGKHYLIRTLGVPANLPCEQCAAKAAEIAQESVPSVMEEQIPQFIWHGESYLNKMWTDTDFLADVSLLGYFTDEIDVTFNPLLLTNEKMQSIVRGVVATATPSHSTAANASKLLLKRLKGRREKKEEAQRYADDLMQPKTIELDPIGIPYRMPGKLPNLDADYLAFTDASKRLKATVEEAMMLTTSSKDAVQGDARETSYSGTQTPYTDDSTISTVTMMTSYARNSIPDKTQEFQEVPDDFTITTRGSTLGGAELGNRQLATMKRLMMESSYSTRKSYQFIEEIDNAINACNMQQLQDALLILGQSPLMCEHLLRSGNHSSQVGTVAVQQVSDTKGGMTSQSMRSGSALFSKTARSTNQAATKGTRRNKTAAAASRPEQPVTTVYEYRGAMLTTVQMRKPVAHRVENVWCRSDVGEWAGLQTKGRAMKAWEYKDRQMTLAKNRIAERIELQAAIREALTYDFVSCDPLHIQSLIKRANELRGSVLALDVIQAELFLEARRKCIASTLFVQRWFRGCQGRKVVKEMLRIKNKEKVWRRKTEEEAAKLCAILVPSIVAEARDNQVKILTKPVFSVIGNLSGSHVVVSAYMCSRNLRKSMITCDACNLRSVVRRYYPATHSFGWDRAPCTCDMIQDPETWRLEVYDPLYRHTHNRNVSACEFTQLIAEAYDASKRSEDYHLKSLVGDSFGSMDILFCPNAKGFLNTVSTTVEKAQLQASKELSTLGLIPRYYSSDFEYALEHTDIPTSIRELFSEHELRTIQRPLLCVSELDAYSSKCWQPLFDVIRANHFTSVVDRVLPVMEEYVRFTNEDFRLRKADFEVHTAHDLERALMEREDARSLVLEITEKYNVACEKVARVMKYSKHELERFTAEEQQSKEDWFQSYNGFENGSEWEGLNVRRKLEVVLKNVVASYFNISSVLDKVRVDNMNLLADYRRAESLLTDNASKIENFRRYAYKVKDAVRRVKFLSLEIVKVLVSRMALRPYRATSIPSNCRVRFPRFDHIYIRDPLRRTRKEHRSLWNVIGRTTLILRPLPGPGRDLQPKLRCIVTIYEDAATKYLIINIQSADGVTQPVEESTMHGDFCNEMFDYSLQTQFCDANEIVITGDDFNRRNFDRLSNGPYQKRALKDWQSDSQYSGLLGDIVLTGEGVNDRSAQLPSLSMAFPSQELISESLITPGALGGLVADATQVKVSVIETAAITKPYRNAMTLFKRRIDNKERKKKANIMGLLRYIRLHPYSHRPCLNLYHLHLRCELTYKRLYQSLWYQDMRKSVRSNWSNAFIAEERTVADRKLFVRIQDNYGDLQFRLCTCSSESRNEAYISTINVAFHDICNSLAHTPLLLASLLCDVICNTYSVDSIEQLINSIDVVLPGEQDRWWRQSIANERLPQIIYLSRLSEQYRGSVYQSHHFISGKFFAVQVYQSSRRDVRIVLTSPTNNSFKLHAYTGKWPITVDIPFSVIRAYVYKQARKYNDELFEKYLSILHPYRLAELYSLVLRNISINFAHLNHLEMRYEDVPVDDQSYDSSVTDESRGSTAVSALGIEVNEPKVLEDKTWRQNLQIRLWQVIQMFNYWVHRNHLNISPISNSLFRKCEYYLRTLEASHSEWRLGDDAEEQYRIAVYDGVWRANDPHRILAKSVHTARKKSRRATLLETPREDDTIFVPQSYWKLLVLTSQDKSDVFVELKETDLLDPAAESETMAHECELMAAEDERSLLSARVQREMEIERHIAERKAAIPAVPSHYILDLVNFRKESVELIAKLREKQRFLFSVADAMFDRLALYSFRYAVDHFEYTSDKGFNLQRDFVSLRSYESQLSIFGEDIGLMDVNDEISPSVLVGRADKWLSRLVKELAKIKNITSPTVALVTSNFKSKGRPSALGNVISTRPIGITSASKASREIVEDDSDGFRNPSAWRRRGQPAAWESGPLSEVDPAFVRRAKNGSQPRRVYQQGNMLLLSAPNVGPYDVSSFNIYDPMYKKKTLVVLHSNAPIPTFRGLDTTTDAPGVHHAVSGSEEDDDERFEQEMINETDHAILKTCARRVVWTSMLHGITTAVIHATESLIAKKITLYERKIAQESRDHWNIYSAVYAEAMTRDSSQQPATHTEAPSIPKEIRLFVIHGMYIPVRDELVPQQFVLSSYDMYRTMKQLLGFRRNEFPRRYTTIPALAYVSPSEAIALQQGHNLRLNRWIFEYNVNTGWRQGIPYIRHKKVMARERNKEYYVEAPDIIGDAFLLFRFGESDSNRLRDWCQHRIDETKEIQHKKAMRARDDNKRRELNYVGFRSLLLEWVAKYRFSFESYFAKFGSFRSYDEITPDPVVTIRHLRVILSRFQADCEQHKDIWSSCFFLDRDEAFLDSSRYLKFEKFNPERFLTGEEYMSFVWEDDIANDIYTLQPTSAQILYGLYHSHCMTCRAPYSACGVPGCGLVRSAVGAAYGDFLSEFDELRGTGRHPIEVQLKVYFRTPDNDLLRSIVPISMTQSQQNMFDEVDDDISDDLSTVESGSALDISLKQPRKSGLFSWRRIREEGMIFRYLYRRVLGASYGSVTAQEVQNCIGGLNYVEESNLSSDVKSSLTPYLPPEDYEALESSMSGSESIVYTPSACELSIPVSIIQQMLGCTAKTWMHDPYPDDTPSTARNAMHEMMYKWIVDRLVLRRDEDNNISMYFNRMHREGLVKLHDESIVLVKILQGVIPGVSRIPNASSGCPEAGQQYVRTDMLSTIQEGLTLLVHDTSCDISRAVVFYGRKLQRFTEKFDLGAQDYPQIAAKIFELAPSIVVLTKIEDMTVDAAIHFDDTLTRKVYEADRRIDMRYKKASGVVTISQRQHVRSRHKERVNIAKNILCK